MSQSKEIQSLHKPTIRVGYPCSPYEIAVIKAMRKLPFGTLKVHIMNYEPRRIVKEESMHLDDAIDLKEVVEELREEGLADQLNSSGVQDGKE